MYVGLTVDILNEKNAKIQEGIKIMGLNSLAYYISYILTYWIQYIWVSIQVFMIIVIGDYGYFHFTASNFALYLIIMMLLSLSYVLFSCMLSTIFDSTKKSSLIMLMSKIIVAVIYTIIPYDKAYPVKLQI